jgi:hypothetical protein
MLGGLRQKFSGTNERANALSRGCSNWIGGGATTRRVRVREGFTRRHEEVRRARDGAGERDGPFQIFYVDPKGDPRTK